MLHRSIIPLFAAAVLALIVTGCTKDPIYPEKTFVVKANSLPVLEGDQYYELWFSYPTGAASVKGQRLDHEDAAYISVGKFRVDAGGAVIGLDGGAAHFAIPEGHNPALIADAAVTVERVSVAHTEPGRRMLTGPFSGTASQGKATLVLDDEEAFGDKLSADSTGWCALDAPTSDAPADSASGIWFVSFKETTPGEIDTTAGLGLAPQPLVEDNPNWTYRAWLTHRQGASGVEYISLGAFTSPDAADANGPGPGAGALPTRFHKAPGEDFVSGTRRVLNDGSYGIVISIDPTDFNATRPLIPIMTLDRIPSGIGRRTLIQLASAAGAPSVEVTVDR